MNLFKQRQPEVTLEAAMSRQYQDGVAVGKNWAILFGGMHSASPSGSTPANRCCPASARWPSSSRSW